MIEISTKELKKSLQFIIKHNALTPKKRLRFMIKFDLQKSYCRIISDSIIENIHCTHDEKKLFSYQIPLGHVYDIVRMIKAKSIQLTFLDHSLKIGNININTVVKIPKIKLATKKFILTTPHATDFELFNLKQQYSDINLKESGILEKVNKATDRVEDNIKKAQAALNAYGVTRVDIFKLINSK